MLEVLDDGVVAREEQHLVAAVPPPHQVGRATVSASHLQDLAVPIGVAHMMTFDDDPIALYCVHGIPLSQIGRSLLVQLDPFSTDGDRVFGHIRWGRWQDEEGQDGGVDDSGAGGIPAKAASGHRCLPHTADLVIEAWGPTREACLEQAVGAAVATFADARGASVTQTLPVMIDAPTDDELLVLLLEEVLYTIEVHESVPVATELQAIPSGGVAGAFRTVPLACVRPVGAVPKAVSRSGLIFQGDPERWFCRLTVDV